MLTHQGTQVLETSRLILRPFLEEDAQPMFDHWANDAKVTRFLTWKPHGNVELTRSLLRDWIGNYSKPNYYQWLIQLEATPVGAVSVVRSDEKNETAELGYCLGTPWWGKGIMTEAVGAVLDFLFGQVGYNRIFIVHAVGNPASGRVAEKNGMLAEGILRQAYKTGIGEYWDLKQYAILKSDWAATRSKEARHSS